MCKSMLGSLGHAVISPTAGYVRLRVGERSSWAAAANVFWYGLRKRRYYILGGEGTIDEVACNVSHNEHCGIARVYTRAGRRSECVCTEG